MLNPSLFQTCPPLQNPYSGQNCYNMNNFPYQASEIHNLNYQIMNPPNVLEQPRIQPNVCCIEQDQHRKILDTFSYCCYPQNQPQQHQNYCYYNNNYPQFCEQYLNQHNISSFYPISQPNHNTTSYGCNLNQLQDRTALELAYLQNQLKERNFYELKFHFDHQTSTTDLISRSGDPKLRADICNFLSSLMPHQNKINHKQLIIKNTAAEHQPSEKSIVEMLEEQSKKLSALQEAACQGKSQETPTCCASDKKSKRITFVDDVDNKNNSADAEAQIHICCKCCEHSSEIESSTEDNSEDNKTPVEEPVVKKKHVKKMRKKRKAKNSEEETD